MKSLGSNSLRTILAIFLGIQFVLIPISELQACSIQPEFKDNYEVCKENPAMEWSCEMNRCIRTALSDDMRKDYQECEKKATQAEQDACYDANAADHVGFGKGHDAKAEKKGLAAMGMVISLITGVLLAVSMGAAGGATQCKSKWTYIAGAAINLISHFYTKSQAKKKMKKLQEKYSKEASKEENSTDEKTGEATAYEEQIQAFQYLKEEQELVAELSESRAKAFMIQTALYFAAGALAVYETFKMTTPPDFGVGTACMDADQEKKAKQGKKDIQKPADGKELTADQVKSNDAVTKSVGETPAASDAPAGTAPTSMFAGQILSTGTSPQIIVTGLVSAAISGMLYNAAKQQAKDAKGNAAAVQRVIEKFEHSVADMCVEGREDVKNPPCYCMTAEGDRNPARTRSNICQAYFAKMDKNYFVDATKYRGKKIDRSGCMTINRKFDESCKCRKFVDKANGQNACFKTGLANANFGALGSGLSLGSLGAMTDALAENGISNIGRINTDAIGKNVAQNKKIMDGMIKKMNEKRAENGFKPIVMNDEVIAKMAAREKNPKYAKAGAASGVGAITASRPAGKLGKALASASIKAGVKKMSYGGGRGIKRGKKGKGNAYNFDFNDGAGSGKGGQVQSFMEKDYKYKGSDIVKREDVSIWKVISNRYINSGLKRLFGDEEGI